MLHIYYESHQSSYLTYYSYIELFIINIENAMNKHRIAIKILIKKLFFKLIIIFIL